MLIRQLALAEEQEIFFMEVYMKKIISFFTAFTLLFSLATVVYASEPQTSSCHLTRDEAMEILNMTEEEAKNVSFYEVIPSDSSLTLRAIPSEINANEVTYEDLTISTSFTGATHKLNGSQFRWGVSISSGSGQLRIGNYSYNSHWPHNGIVYNNLQNGNTYSTDWMDIEYGQYYYLRYYNDSGSVFHARIVMAVV